jgi:hypothetical protein
MMGRQEKEGNHFSPPNNKLVQEPDGNEENRCQNQTTTK